MGGGGCGALRYPPSSEGRDEDSMPSASRQLRYLVVVEVVVVVVVCGDARGKGGGEEGWGGGRCTFLVSAALLHDGCIHHSDAPKPRRSIELVRSHVLSLIPWHARSTALPQEALPQSLQRCKCVREGARRRRSGGGGVPTQEEQAPARHEYGRSRPASSAASKIYSPSCTCAPSTR